jgi:GTP-binding protein Era
MKPGDGNAEFRCGTVAILGWTNVGKSTLLNRLVGVKLAAVADVAQTTRYRISAVRGIPGRGQIVFIDTPGLHRPRHKMNRAMLDSAMQSIWDVDLVLFVVDAERGMGAGDQRAAERLGQADAPRLMVLNKIDRVRPKSRLLPMMRDAIERWGCSEVIPVSALTGDGCDDLIERVLARLPRRPALFPDDYLTDQPERVLAAEWIREKLLAETRQELPHATAVLVERWQEREDGLLEIDATILVDRVSQKRIVIGKRGELLKRVGSAARVDIERFLERRLFLRLWVKVREDWRDDETVLDQLGLR